MLTKLQAKIVSGVEDVTFTEWCKTLWERFKHVHINFVGVYLYTLSALMGLLAMIFSIAMVVGWVWDKFKPGVPWFGYALAILEISGLALVAFVVFRDSLKILKYSRISAWTLIALVFHSWVCSIFETRKFIMLSWITGLMALFCALIVCVQFIKRADRGG